MRWRKGGNFSLWADQVRQLFRSRQSSGGIVRQGQQDEGTQDNGWRSPLTMLYVCLSRSQPIYEVTFSLAHASHEHLWRNGDPTWSPPKPNPPLGRQLKLKSDAHTDVDFSISFKTEYAFNTKNYVRRVYGGSVDITRGKLYDKMQVVVKRSELLNEP